MRLDPSSIRVSRWTAALVLGAASLFGGMAVAAQDVVVTPAPEPAATAEEGRLQAIFMDVQGRVRWRATENSPWQTAKVNALVDPGSQIQTSLNSRATLRVGKNASVLMDPGSDLVLPEVAKDGETLRTVASVRAGRVDFKVDKVGLTNDFKVVTPSTTLAVRGTAFPSARVSLCLEAPRVWDALDGELPPRSRGAFVCNCGPRATPEAVRLVQLRNAAR